VLAEDVQFDGTTFRAGEETDAKYRFDSYRLTYRYRLVDNARWQVQLGLTGKIRDAEIALEQEEVSQRYTNTGFVPLLHADVQYALGAKTRAVFTGDFLAAPQGRAEDVALLLRQDFSKGWDLSAGYRTVEGGADNDKVYTFAWLNYAVVQVAYSFGGSR
jgi:hypothetical protein